MEKSKKIYVLWDRYDLITFFNEDELEDLFELIADLNFEEAYCYFCDLVDCGEEIETALDYSRWAEGWHWHELERLV